MNFTFAVQRAYITSKDTNIKYILCGNVLKYYCIQNLVDITITCYVKGKN